MGSHGALVTGHACMVTPRWGRWGGIRAVTHSQDRGKQPNFQHSTGVPQAPSLFVRITIFLHFSVPLPGGFAPIQVSAQMPRQARLSPFTPSFSPRQALLDALSPTGSLAHPPPHPRHPAPPFSWPEIVALIPEPVCLPQGRDLVLFSLSLGLLQKYLPHGKHLGGICGINGRCEDHHCRQALGNAAGL